MAFSRIIPDTVVKHYYLKGLVDAFTETWLEYIFKEPKAKASELTAKITMENDGTGDSVITVALYHRESASTSRFLGKYVFDNATRVGLSWFELV